MQLMEQNRLSKAISPPASPLLPRVPQKPLEMSASAFRISNIPAGDIRTVAACSQLPAEQPTHRRNFLMVLCLLRCDEIDLKHMISEAAVR